MNNYTSAWLHVAMTEIGETDRRIIEKLRENARRSVSEIAKDLRLPRTTVADRIRHLERQRTILGYTARLNHSQLGEGQTAFVMLQVGRNPAADSNEFPARVNALAGVEEFHAIAGEWDALVKVRAASMNDLFSLVERIARVPGVARTVTLTCFKTLREPV